MRIGVTIGPPDRPNADWTSRRRSSSSRRWRQVHSAAQCGIPNGVALREFADRPPPIPQRLPDADRPQQVLGRESPLERCRASSRSIRWGWTTYRTSPMAMTAATVPRNAPPLTTPIALPNRRAGLDVRAMSKVITAVIVGAGTASASATSSQIGAQARPQQYGRPDHHDHAQDADRDQAAVVGVARQHAAQRYAVDQGRKAIAPASGPRPCRGTIPDPASGTGNPTSPRMPCP